MLDLNEICARRIAALAPGELPNARGETEEKARAELTRKLDEFLHATFQKNAAEAEALAKATAHGANRKKVRELAAEIRQRLEATPNKTVPFVNPNADIFQPEPAASPTPASGATPTPPATSQ